jgi:hypothetical protein
MMHRYYLPNGSICKGNSVFPFMPKCHCPASHNAASNEGDGLSTISILPSIYLSWRSTWAGICLIRRIIWRREVRVFGKYWPFSTCEDKCEVEVDEKDTGLEGTRTRRRSSVQGTNDPTRIMEEADAGHSKAKSVPSSRSGSSGTSEPIPQAVVKDLSSSHAPHLHYGRPDSTLEHRRFPWHLINTFNLRRGKFCTTSTRQFHGPSWCDRLLLCVPGLEIPSRMVETVYICVGCCTGCWVPDLYYGDLCSFFSLILRGAIKFPSWVGNDDSNVERYSVGDGYN